LDKESAEEEKKTIRRLISVIRVFSVAILVWPAWFLYFQEIRVGRSDGNGVVKFVRWDESPKEFLALMLLTLFVLGIFWVLAAYINKHLQLQIRQIEAKLEESETLN
jgi:hypothetical protein